MGRMDSARRAALVVAAGAVGIAGASATASAQRSHPVAALAVELPTPPRPMTPYPGATVTIEPGWYGRQQPSAPARESSRRHQPSANVVVYYAPVATSYPSYPSAGYGGGVYDTNGRPLYSGFDAPATSQYAPTIGTPDLSGSPYVAVEGGAMVVDFGNGDRRTIPSCAALASEGTPDGQPRTVFFRPATDGLVLRAGQRGRVIGAPTAGARVCYTVDAYGRMVLDY